MLSILDFICNRKVCVAISWVDFREIGLTSRCASLSVDAAKGIAAELVWDG